jgi:hypothetical protein
VAHRFVDKPAIAWGVPAGPGRINQQGVNRRTQR